MQKKNNFLSTTVYKWRALKLYYYCLFCPDKHLHKVLSFGLNREIKDGLKNQILMMLQGHNMLKQKPEEPGYSSF